MPVSLCLLASRYHALPVRHAVPVMSVITPSAMLMLSRGIAARYAARPIYPASAITAVPMMTAMSMRRRSNRRR